MKSNRSFVSLSFYQYIVLCDVCCGCEVCVCVMWWCVCCTCPLQAWEVPGMDPTSPQPTPGFYVWVWLLVLFVYVYVCGVCVCVLCVVFCSVHVCVRYMAVVVCNVTLFCFKPCSTPSQDFGVLSSSPLCSNWRNKQTSKSNQNQNKRDSPPHELTSRQPTRQSHDKSTLLHTALDPTPHYIPLHHYTTLHNTTPIEELMGSEGIEAEILLVGGMRDGNHVSSHGDREANGDVTQASHS